MKQGLCHSHKTNNERKNIYEAHTFRRFRLDIFWMCVYMYVCVSTDLIKCMINVT